MSHSGEGLSTCGYLLDDGEVIYNPAVKVLAVFPRVAFERLVGRCRAQI